MDEEKFLKTIMNSFRCDRKMAETIYRSSKKTGELDSIKFIAGEERNENK